jgi:ribonucleoside-triphosphate reductase
MCSRGRRKLPNNGWGKTRHDYTAIEHLELWLEYTKHWCEHKPSITVSVKEHEWEEVGNFVFEHWKYMSGVAFLPWDGGTYVQAPYEAVTREVYERMVAEAPEIDWSFLQYLETEDTTETAKELACMGGACAI